MSLNRKIKTVGVLGAGNWGTVVAMLGASNCENVLLFDHHPERAGEIQKTRENKRYLPGFKLPENVRVTSDLEEIFHSAKLILPVIPAKAFRSLCRQYGPYTNGEHILVHCTKGLEPGTNKRMSEILIEETSTLRIGVLSGPNIAQEIAAGMPCATVVSSRFDEVILKMQRVS